MYELILCKLEEEESLIRNFLRIKFRWTYANEEGNVVPKTK
jgi:hypothetical protein